MYELKKSVSNIFKLHSKNNESFGDTIVRLGQYHKDGLYLIYKTIPNLVTFNPLINACSKIISPRLLKGEMISIANVVIIGLPNEKRIV